MILTHLEIDYYKSFGKGVSVDIPKGISLLIGNNKDSIGMDSNEAGKTNFTESLAWCITGTPPDQSNADEVIHHGKDYCRVKSVFQDNEDTVSIERKRTLSSSSNKLYFRINGELQNQETTVPSKVQKTINNYFGIKGTRGQILKDIMITNMLNYDSVENFAKNSKDKERFNFISRIFDLEKWDDCREICRDKKKKIQKKLDSIEAKKSVYEKKLENTSLSQLNQDIDNADNNIRQLKENKKDLQERKETLVKLEDKFKKKIKLQKQTKNIKQRIKNKKDAKESDIQEEKENIQNYQNETKSLKNEIKETDKSLEDLNSDLESIQEDIKGIDKDISDTQSQINKKTGQTLYKINNKINSKENELKQSLSCPECNSDLMKMGDSLKKFDKETIESKLNDLKKQKKKVKKEINNIKSNKKDLEDKKDNLIDEKEDIENDIQTIKDNQSKQQLIKDKKESIKKCKQRIEKTKRQKNKDIEQLKKDLQEKQEELDELEDIDANENITQSIKQIEDKIQKFIKDIEKTQERKMEFKNKIDNYKEAQKNIKKLKHNYKKEQKKHEALQYWYDNFPEIKRMIIQSTLPNIEQLTNHYLEEMEVPLSIQLSTLEETKTTGNKKQAFNIKVYDQTQDKTVKFYSRSLGGRKRIGIALCFALQEIKSSNLPNWFEFKFLDELLENLDSTGQNNIFNLIQKKGQYIVTSHNNDLKDKFNNIITVEKENGISKVIINSR